MPQMFGNLSIRPRLVGLLAAAVVAVTALLVAVGVTGGVGDRARARHDRRLAVVAVRAATAAHELQEERVRAAAWLAAEGRRGERELRDQRRRADRVVAAYRAGVAGLGPAGDPALDHLLAVSGQRLGRLAGVRAETDRRPAVPQPSQAGHDAIVAGLLEVQHALVERVAVPGPVGWARLQLALAEAKEATARERTVLADPSAGGVVGPGAARGPGQVSGQGATGGPGQVSGQGAAGGPASASDQDGTGRASLPDPGLARLLAAAAVARRELGGVRAAAGDRLRGIDAALATPAVGRARQLELDLLEPAAVGPSPGALAQLRAGLDARGAALRRLERALAGDLATLADARLRRQEARLRAQLRFLAALALVAPAVAFLLVRGAAGRPEAAPAAGGTVAGLARRGQALLERQLQLVKDLEREEPDPDRRLDLARVGHLTARQRRGTELLLTLAGPGPARRWEHPVPLDALLRAAVAHTVPQGRRERRVELLVAGEVQVVGPAAADLVHLVAELVDNAVAFSPPTAAVAVTGGRDGAGWLIEVSDGGLGMIDEELAWANQRLAGGQRADPADLAAGDRLGLVVAGRLATRHGIGVRLTRSDTGGVTAAVRLPAALLSGSAPAPVQTR
jgi:Nitrate and nitrite sensing/Histidine kinase-, DNA gyrase B-, and HSP90-like ATPase